MPYLERRIEEGVLNCNKLWDELHKQGYEGGKSLIKSFVQPYREARRVEASMRFETTAGQQAQVDWGHFGFIAHDEHRRRLYAFAMTLGWSRAFYLEFTVSPGAPRWARPPTGPGPPEPALSLSNRPRPGLDGPHPRRENRRRGWSGGSGSASPPASAPAPPP